MMTDADTPTAGRRLAAFGWDYLIIAAYIVVLTATSFLARRQFGDFVNPDRSNPGLYDLVAFLTLVLPVVLYFALSEASAAGATWGKRRMGLGVRASSGSMLTVQQSLVRSATKFLPWQIAHTCLFHIPGWPLAATAPPAWVIAGFAVVFVLVGAYLSGLLFSRTGLTPYDRAARTRVVIAVPALARGTRQMR
jgi:uncharacterized RDD family membrane protein YckC